MLQIYIKICDNHYKLNYFIKILQYSDCYFVLLLCLCSREEFFDSKLMHMFSFTCTISLYFIPLQKYEFNLNTSNISTVFSSNLNKIIPFFQFFRNTDGWQGWQTPPQKNWKLVSPASPNKLAPIKGAAENGDRWHFYILFFLWLTARK